MVSSAVDEQLDEPHAKKVGARTARLSRRELYDLVWAEPMRTLASRFGVSDVAMKKACARAQIPTPDRGYWAKSAAGKPTRQAPFPPRPPGMSEEIQVGGGSNGGSAEWSRGDLSEAVPPPPQFDDPIETVRERIALTLGPVTVPRSVRSWHPAIERLLGEDEKRRQKQAASRFPMSWDAPLFDTPLERRRLRILDALFRVTAKLDGKPNIRGREAREIHVTFHQQHVRLTLDPPKPSSAKARNASPTPPDRLCFAVLAQFGSSQVRASWTDDDAGMLEARMTEIAVEFVLTAELQHREGAVRHHQWRVERKAQFEKEERKRLAEAKQAERDRLARLEQDRIDRLLRDAAAFHQANEIRDYVAAVAARVLENGSVDAARFDQWRDWSLTQADRIDPTVGGAFLKVWEGEKLRDDPS